MATSTIIPRLGLNLGANYLGDGRCRFLVWAPFAKKVEVHIVSPYSRYLSLEPRDRNYFEGVLNGVRPGTLYLYRLDGKEEFPDPASRFQPRGVLGPSQVVNPVFNWEDSSWHNLLLQKFIIYELHVGTFTPEGSFESIIQHLNKLIDLGITAVELMPVAQFPGNRNWGYDGVYPFATQNSYGSVNDLKSLVNACHKKGLAVILDVVYNHMGPEGCFLDRFGPYFTDRYKTTWGKAINFDGQGSDDVRRYFIENALYWIIEFHIDALRLDATHAILDFSPFKFLEELRIEVKEESERLNRKIYLIAENDLNDWRLVSPRNLGGYGLDAQWNDDFHHALHVLLTGENTGYYQDFGQVWQMAKALKNGFVYSGEYSSFRGQRHGSTSEGIPLYRFVVYSQNHDQVGNRMKGDRLSHIISFDSLKLAAGAVILSPSVPLIYMGEEYGETAYFPYFVSHNDSKLVDAVRQGRKAEFASFQSSGNPPDPQSEETFRSAKLHKDMYNQAHHKVLYDFHRELIQLRKKIGNLINEGVGRTDVLPYEKQKCLFYIRENKSGIILLGFNFSDLNNCISLPIFPGKWNKLMDSSEQRWQGTGSPISDHIVSDGEITLELNPRSFIILSGERSQFDI